MALLGSDVRGMNGWMCGGEGEVETFLWVRASASRGCTICSRRSSSDASWRFTSMNSGTWGGEGTRVSQVDVVDFIGPGVGGWVRVAREV